MTRRLSTVVACDPVGFRHAARWLRDDLAPALGFSDAALCFAREDRSEWQGMAATAFRERVRSLVSPAADAEAAARAAATEFDAFAHELEVAISEVEAIRTAATAAGLSVTTTSILSPPTPGPAPAHPGPVATPAQLHQYALAVSAYRRAVGLADAYDCACDAMSAVVHRLASASAALDDARANAEALAIPALDFTAGAFVAARTAQGVAAIRGHSRFLLETAEAWKQTALTTGRGMQPHQIYDYVDDAMEDAAALRTRAAALSDDAARLVRAGRLAGAGAGAVLTVPAIISDIEAGESTGQAVVSNGAGLVASIGAGAATGVLLGSVVPGLGNVAGGVIGAAVGGVVGIVTSGMVDSVFEEGPDVGAALANGWQDLADTGVAAWELGGAAVEGAGNLISSAGDGLSDAWARLF